MAKGKATTKYVGREGVVTPQTQPSWDFLYRSSTVKDPEYEIGDRVVLPDGRVFRYCLQHASSQGGAADVEAGRGVKFVGRIADDGIASAVDRAQVIGDKELHYASQSFAKDELRGGYVIIYSAGSTYQQAGIVGNTYCSSSALTIYLDRSLATAVTSTQYTEVLPNPYRFIGLDTSNWNSVAGVPMSTPTAAQYFWIQTWGPCWINPGPNGMGAVAGERRTIWNADGSMREGEVGNDNSQTAGFIIQMDAELQSGADGPPFIMLQISP